MPSTYAHYRMGQQVAKKVPQKIREIISENKQLYDIGLHGPDILFYYAPLFANEVNATGFGMHERPGKEFFQYAVEIVKEHEKDPKYLAYVYGFICHFSLDVTCHGYIDDKIAESGVSHAEIEVEFDRKLMLVDGKKPLTQKLTNHILPSKENAKVIADFFENVKEMEVKGALNSMIRYNNLLIAPTKTKRFLVNSLLKLTGNYKEMHGLMVNFKANPKCEDSTRILRQLYDIALNRAVDLICEFDQYLNDEKKINPIYDYTFGGKELEKEEEQHEIQNDENRKELGTV